MPDPARFPSHCIYYPPDSLDRNLAAIFGSRVLSDGSSAARPESDSSSSILTLGALSAREDRTAEIIKANTDDGFFDFEGQRKWALSDGLGGVCVFTEIYPRGTLVKALMLLTGESDEDSALIAFETRARYPHLSSYTMKER